MAKSELAVPEPAELEKPTITPVEFGYAAPGMSFDDLADEAVTLPGHDLVKDDELDALVGVDFIVTRVNFREGLARRDGNMWMKQFPEHRTNAYVSVELSTNPHLVITNINRARVASKLAPVNSLDHLGFDPGEHFVINDGSTGIYRQVVAFLAMTRYIELPGGENPVLEGPSGHTALDTIPEEWTEVHAGDVKFDPSGFQTYAANVRIRCRRGLRISEYESEFNPDSKTRYLA